MCIVHNKDREGARVCVKTSSSQLGPKKGGKCKSIGLSAVCPSKVAMIHSMVVAVMSVKADWVWN